METNNREFILLRYKMMVSIIILLLIYIFSLSKEILFIDSVLCIFYMYYSSKRILKSLFTDMRHVIDFASGDQEFMIKDGDLGLLYDEIVILKKRTTAYQETIQKEKNKLRQTIEDICHQLKTPLASVSIYNELLLEEQPHHYLIETQQQIEKMKYLINSLLKLAKLQGSQVDFDFQYLPIYEVLQLSLQALHSLIQQTSTSITIEKTEAYLYYDESWLQEALSNIIKNSLEHGCSKIKVTFEEHQQYIKCFIYNNGEEIKEKDLPHLFERFYHSAKQQGVGIGLALSKEIIEKHHGLVIAYNDNGVVFEITFPLFQMNDKYKVS